MMKLNIYLSSIILLSISVLYSEGLYASPVVIVMVRPSKITYLVGENAKSSITLNNSTSSNIKGILKVTDEWDSDNAREIFSREISVPAKGETAVDVSWINNNECYGHALKAEFLLDGKTISNKSEFFQVSRKDNWFRTFIINGGSNRNPNRVANLPFSTYSNYKNFFAYALSDCVALAPEPDFYYSGQTAYPIDKKKMIADIRDSHNMGCRSGGYTQTVTGGPAGYEFARQHPDWFARDPRGAFHTSGSPVSPIFLDGPVDKKPPKEYTSRTFFMLVPDFGNPQMRRYAADEIVRAFEMFDFDAMYFDTYPYGMFYWPNRGYDETMFTWEGKPLNRGKDPDPFTVEILSEIRRIIRKSCPDIAIWYNGLLSIAAWKHATDIAALKVSQTGSLVELQGKSIIDDAPYSNWRVLYESLINRRNMIMKNPEINSASFLVGYLYNTYFDKLMSKEEFQASRDTWTMSNHLGSIILASHFHPCLLCSSSFRPSVQFMTRYSSFLWDERIRLLDRPWERMSVISNREVWWEEACYERQCDTFKDTIIHLVNAPEKETTDYKASEDPPSVQNAILEMNAPAKPGIIKAWMMEPYNYDNAAQEPTQIELDVRRSDHMITIPLPPFTYHAMIVVREYK